jgi:heat shock protein HslJ
VRKILLVSVVVLLGAACGDDDDGDAATSPTASETSASETTGSETASSEASGSILATTTWALASVDGAAVQVEGVSWIAFGEDGQVTGNGGCNDFNGPYTDDGESLTIGPLAATLRACADPVLDEQEAAFFAVLDATERYTLHEGTLTLQDGEGGELAVLAAVLQPAGIAGSWEVTGYNNGAEAVVSPLVDTEITAEFAEDGTVSGSSGCNTYTGGYTLEADTVTIGPLASTRMACAEPEGVMDQEQQYLAALESGATWSIRGGILEFRNADDAIAVTMVSAG